ncbi:MAG: DUF427 domain-containing protein [Ktedonobacterales bacterium]
MKATWNGATLAESDATIEVEGSAYFPREAIRAEHFQESEHHTVYSWKGTASYLDVVVNGQVNANAAWYYPQPKDAAAQITDYVAFWHGVTITP